jgi:hypothetical protein
MNYLYWALYLSDFADNTATVQLPVILMDIQWPKEKVQKDKQRSTKHTHKTKDRVTRTPLKTGGELRRSGKVSNFCSTSSTCHVNLVTKIIHIVKVFTKVR